MTEKVETTNEDAESIIGSWVERQGTSGIYHGILNLNILPELQDLLEDLDLSAEEFTKALNKKLGYSDGEWAVRLERNRLRLQSGVRMVDVISTIRDLLL